MAVAEKREPFPDSRPVKRRRLRSIEKEGIRAVRNFEIKLRAVKSLTLYAGNPRTHSTKQIRQIANSIVEFGWTVPIVIDRNGRVIAGHALHGCAIDRTRRCRSANSIALSENRKPRLTPFRATVRCGRHDRAVGRNTSLGLNEFFAHFGLSGVVTDTLAEPGQVVAAGQTLVKPGTPGRVKRQLI